MIDVKSQIDAETLDKAHACMTEILSEIDRVCQKHDIKWWIEDGTLLGALRHKGFIPWDDDCDIGMMREDYEKFVKFASKDLGDKFVFQARGIDPLYPKRLPKVRKLGTKLVEHDEDFNEKYFQGIYVDIFVWDYFYGWEQPLSHFFNIMPHIRTKRKKYPKHTWKRTLHGILTAVPYALHRCLELMYLGFRSTIRKNKSLPFISYEAQMSNELFYKREVIFPLRRDYVFEGKYFPVPNNPEQYLTDMYGDYMQLPPPEQRHTHARLIEC